MPAAYHVPVALNLLDPNSLLASAGALALFLVIFAETGLLIGFFPARRLAAVHGRVALHDRGEFCGASQPAERPAGRERAAGPAGRAQAPAGHQAIAAG